MKRLIRLTKTLKPKEVHFLKEMYRVRNTKVFKESLKLKLFKLILKNQVSGNKDALEKLCPNHHNSLISQVKKKLEADILNIILVSSFTDTEKQQNQREFNCYKNFLLGKVLIERGLPEEGIGIICKTSHLAEKAGLFDIKINCDDMSRSFYDQYYGENRKFQYQQKAEVSIDSFNSLLHAKSINLPFMHGHSLVASCEQFNLDIEILRQKINNSNCKKTKHWYTMAIIHFYIQKGDYANAKSFCLDLLQNAISFIEISEYQREEFYLQLARILIYLKEPAEAIKAAQCSLEHMSKENIEVTPAFQILFRAHLLLNNLKEAEEIIIKSYKKCNDFLGESFNIWPLYKAVLFFSKGDYKESNKILIGQQKELNEKSPRKLYSKLFELLNIFEIGDFDWFEYKLEAFRKIIHRNNIMDTVRLQYLYSGLSRLKHNHFLFNNFQPHEGKPILHSGTSIPQRSMEWNPLGYEIIDVKAWLKKKAIKKENALKDN